MILNSHFTNLQFTLLITGIALVIGSVFFHYRAKYSVSLILLLLASACIFSFAALLDSFLNLWDERFHALVAKNMMTHPFKPMLYADPVLDIAYDRWDRFHIWLHKQPLFMWQMALSFKLFGVGVFQTRLPSVLMCTILSAVIYRSGTLILNRNVGFYASILFLSSFYIIEVLSGRQLLEQNDIQFLGYVSLSIWAWLEYIHSGKKKWLYLIGLFSGCAILVKWVVGLLVYSAWGLMKLLGEKRFVIKEYWDLALSLIITIGVALPWQLYIFLRFPEEAKSNFEHNAKHFSQVVEAHQGPWWYHFDMFTIIYGTLGVMLLIPGVYYLKEKIQLKKLWIPFISLPVIVYLFFSLSATKMPSFTLIATLPILIIIASSLSWAQELIEKLIKSNSLKLALFILLLSALFIFRLDIAQLEWKHTDKQENNDVFLKMNHNKEIFENLDLKENDVLFNIRGRHYVEAMFHTNNTAYNLIPSPEQVKELKLKGRNVVLLKNTGRTIPDYLKNNPEVRIIDNYILGYD